MIRRRPTPQENNASAPCIECGGPRQPDQVRRKSSWCNVCEALHHERRDRRRRLGQLLHRPGPIDR